MIRATRLLPAVALLALSVVGCSASKASGPGTSTARSAGTTGADGAPEISNRAKVLFEDALKAFENQKKAKAFNYESLERKFNAALDADENLAEADYNLGVLAERQGKLPEAKQHYLTALKKKPSLRQATDNLAVLAQNAGDVPTALALYQDTLTRYPEDALSRARLAEIYRSAADHDKAMEFARAALVRDPRSLAAYKVMMRSYVDRKQFAMAKLVALRATKIDENDPELYYTVAMIFLQEGKPDDARLQLKRTLEIRPDYLPAHEMLAQLSLDAEDYVGAEEHLRRVLQADGKNAAAHLNLGVAYKGQGQYDKAMQEYDAAEKLNPELAAVSLNRAIILHRAKDAPERALELYKRYVATAGGEVALNADAPVFALIRETEGVLQAKDEGKRAEEEAKRMEAVAAQEKKLADQQAAQEKKNIANAGGAEKAPAKKPTSGKAAGEPVDELDNL